MRTTAGFLRMKKKGEKIAAITAYDATFAAAVLEAGCDTALVGDSLGNVIQGRPTTHGVTVGDVAYHVRCARRGAPGLHLMADLPFGSYENGPEQAFASAAKLLRAGAQMVKLEGGAEYAPTIEYLVDRGVPVCGHVGLLPQSALVTGLKVQGKDEGDADRILADAMAVSESGATLVVLELIPPKLAEKITGEVRAATVGIGAGPCCDGQILVLHDVLGISKAPPFAKDFLAESDSIKEALAKYVYDVRNARFPAGDGSD